MMISPKAEVLVEGVEVEALLEMFHQIPLEQREVITTTILPEVEVREVLLAVQEQQELQVLLAVAVVAAPAALAI